MYKEITKCRICGNNNLTSIINLGTLSLTGIFPKNKSDSICSGPLELIKCMEDAQGKFCGLVQLRHSFDLNTLYGDNYGYRSGLNKSMVEHLHCKVNKILSLINLSKDDLVIDIGSNDCTTLNAYPKEGLVLVGIDPTGNKFRKYYPSYIHLIPDFFSAEVVKSNFGNKKAKIITSISMFYDLEEPIHFMREIYKVLADDGIWVFEQSYLPTMLSQISYDTICHEHLEYYALKQIKYMTDKVGFEIIGIEFNNVNGGSFSITAAKSESNYKAFFVDNILNTETNQGLSTLKPYKKFVENTLRHREKLLHFIHTKRKEGFLILGYGASTKGNVILQFCDITKNEIPYIAEINEDKIGCYTPGTNIPIISEQESNAMGPDYFMVLPWHFKDNIVKREQQYLINGGQLLFPLPTLEVFSK